MGDNCVLIKTEYHGTYIGILEEVFYARSTLKKARVSILACIEYPRQNAILFRDRLAPRRPYKFGDRVEVDYSCVSVFTGTIPAYGISVREALQKSLNESGGVFKSILIEHWEGLDHAENNNEITWSKV